MNTKRVPVFFIFTALFSISIFGCSKKTDEPQRTTASTSASQVYPHSNSFKTMGNIHGALFLSNRALCQTCHGQDYRGNPQFPNTSCYRCHSSYPHSQTFTQRQEHGSAYRNTRTACASCHGGTSLAGTATAPSCTSCHSTYPHSSTFAQKQEHGPTFLNNRISCQNCHGGANLSGTATAPSCSSCHTTYPHASNFNRGASHGAAFLSNSASCRHCHGATLLGMTSAPACTSCHASYPHIYKPQVTNTFSKGKEHGVLYRQNPAACKVCHLSTLLGTQTSPSCTTCHSVFPHSVDFIAGSPSNLNHHKYYYGTVPRTPSSTSLDMNRPRLALCADCHIAGHPFKQYPSGSTRSSCSQCHAAWTSGAVNTSACSKCH